MWSAQQQFCLLLMICGWFTDRQRLLYDCWCWFWPCTHVSRFLKIDYINLICYISHRTGPVTIMKHKQHKRHHFELQVCNFKDEIFPAIIYCPTIADHEGISYDSAIVQSLLLFIYILFVMWSIHMHVKKIDRCIDREINMVQISVKTVYKQRFETRQGRCTKPSLLPLFNQH